MLESQENVIHTKMRERSLQKEELALDYVSSMLTCSMNT